MRPLFARAFACEVQIFDYTVAVRGGPMWLSRKEDAMATTTTGVGHPGKEPTVVDIDGFRGRLIGADHADYDIARAVWNGALDRRRA